jgi:Carboxypeptidase regulatory-like domain
MMGSRYALATLFSLAVAVGQETNASLTGTVVDPAGAVIPNTRVLLSGQMSSETRTNQLGEFAIRGLPLGSYVLRLKSPGFRTRSRRVSLQGGQHLSLGLIALQIGPVACEGEWIHGQVTQERVGEEAPPRLYGIVQGAFSLSNVFVVVRKAGTSEVVATKRADELGEFEFRDLPLGDYSVDVSHDGRTHLATERLSLQQGFDVELTTGWGTGLCVTAR